MAEFVRVAAVAEVPPGTLLAVDVGEISVCLANADDQIYAFRNNCSHRDFQLDTGDLEGERVTCAWHGARFDIRTGRALSLPAIKPIVTYEVRVENGDIFVAVED
jgi:3-phenylpropionate/trans-cinnamate dioxygenase ferredoxin component